MKPENRTSDQKRSQDDAVAENGQPPVPPDTDAEAVDARKDPEKLKENRERLGVDDEHKTPDMKKQRRGTFP